VPEGKISKSSRSVEGRRFLYRRMMKRKLWSEAILYNRESAISLKEVQCIWKRAYWSQKKSSSERRRGLGEANL